VELSGLFVFIAAAGVLVARNMLYTVRFLALQGIALTAMVLTSAPLSLTVLGLALATLIIKGGLIPTVMGRVIRQWPAEYRQDMPLPLWAYLVGAGLVVAVGHVIQVLAPTGLILHRTLFFYGLASIHLGLLTVVSRRHVLSQITALVVIENGLVALAASVAGALPTFMELGMLVDLAVAASVLLWMSRRIHHQTGSTDVAALRRLRG
jgi:hydrogenase-4 component E